MKKITSALFIACISFFLILTSAHGDGGPSQGYYLSGSMGIAFLGSGDVKNPTIRAAATHVDFKSKEGLALGAAVGYGFGSTRLEGEISYQRNELQEARVAGLGSVDLAGHTTCFAFLLNGYYDFSNESPFTTFITVGMGAARVSINDRLENLPGMVNPYLDDRDTVFAYQAGLGVGYAITEKVTFDVKYRYFGMSNPKFRDATEFEYSSNNIYAGIRYRF